ncbi:lipocalin family protein [Salegentibacter sediminis]|uniref:lipocalin family protein n=1 Tax=Salegentibacter sediminis TaxID=1930251 RepID=UPI000DA135CB|nr:lipocalin family protein [Salegentibacter sediminis]
MNKIILYSLIGIVLLSCNKQDPEAQVKYIEGYWEIDKAELPGDSVRKYSINENIDYFEITDSTGFRKKLQPQFDGSYKTSAKAEELRIKIEDDSLRLYYKTPFDQWKETLLEADEEKMSILNKDGIIYHYKKFTPLFAKEDEEE